MKTVRTSDTRFAGLVDFTFSPHYAEIDDPAAADNVRAWEVLETFDRPHDLARVINEFIGSTH
jgi:hypothetical protein